jgi:hypothetical protein
MVFGYSGLAEMGSAAESQHLPTELAAHVGPRPLALWLADQLYGSPSLNEGLTRLPDLLRLGIQRLRVDRRLARLAIRGVGWATLETGGPLLPIELTIENALNETGEWDEHARGDFRITGLHLAPSTPYRIRSLGAPISTRATNRAERIVRSACDREVNPWCIVRVLARLIRQTSKRSPTVGQSLLAAVVPRMSVLSNTEGLSEAHGEAGRLPPIPTAPSFCHLPAHANDWSFASPAYASPNMQAFMFATLGREFDPSMIEDHL